MSTQKLLAEAEKLLERGKTDEAITKLKSCVTSEPNNQLIVNRLAQAYLAVGDEPKAVDTLAQFAQRMAKAGKPQVAVAIYKQALDIAPQNAAVILEYAICCEEAGKLSEASAQAQKLLSYYLPRKKYFDALNLFPLLARISPKDEKIKALWIDAMTKGMAEMKLVHMLVAVLGPPGLVSSEFQTGGDPLTVSPPVFAALQGLLLWFPRDPKLPYALAWASYKRGDLKAAYGYLHESIRRDPDFVLAPLLFARILGESQKLNECLFVYKYVKERVISDKQVDVQVLNRQLESFEQKNGWISFAEGEEISAEQFKKNFLSPESSAETSAEGAAGASESADASPSTPAAAEKEIDIGLPPSEAPMEVELGASGKETAAEPAALASKEAVEFTSLIETPPKTAPAPAQTPKVVESPPEEKPADEPQQNKSLYEVKFTPAPSAQVPEQMAPAPVAPEPAEPPPSAAPPVQELSPLDLIERATSKIPAGVDREEKTEIISRDAIKDLVTEQSAPPATDSVFPEQEDKTEIISRDALKELADETGEPQSLLDGMKEEAAPIVAVESQPEMQPEQNFEQQAAPVVTVEPQPEVEDATKIVSLSELKQTLEFTSPVLQEEAKRDPEPAAAAPNVEFTAEPEPIDLGDDLLEGPTEMIEPAPEPENTRHLVQEIKKKEEAEPEAEAKPEDFLRFADSYLAKRNYYMARKSLRHALALGGDEAAIKSKLRDIRKLELPDSLYASASNDEAENEPIDSVLSRLEREFQLTDEIFMPSPDSQAKIDSLLASQDEQTLMDIGVGFIEMGLTGEAEKLFEKLSHSADEKVARAAIYLLARAKYDAHDFSGAVGELQRLTRRPGITRGEQLSVFYALGEAFEKMRRKGESQKYYKKAAEIDANYRKVKDKLGEKDL